MDSILREPSGEEWKDCVRLLYISGPDLYTYIFIDKDPDIYELFHLMFSNPGIYSKSNVIVETEDNIIRGLILAYSARDQMKMGKQMLKLTGEMIKIAGLSNFLKMILRLKFNAYFPENEDDEYFISNLAVFEQYRGRGIASELLRKTEETARSEGMKKLTLYVEIDNSTAIKVYRKYGFTEYKKFVLPKKYNRHNLFGFYKMVKSIG